MGAHYEFKCEKCGLAATVSGGPDRGFEAVTDTRFCRPCGEIFDVLIAVIPEAAPEDHTHIGCCPRCNGTDLMPWKRGEPCPRCGGSVKEGEMVDLWD